MRDAPATLLLVDDDEAKRYVLATWLRRAGYVVREVGTGREALASVAGADLVEDVGDAGGHGAYGVDVRAPDPYGAPGPVG